MAFNREKVIRMALGQGGLVFPAIAGRIAFNLFCRTNDASAPSKGEQKAIDRAAPFMAQAHTVRLQNSQDWIAVHWFAARSPLKGKLLLLHGWASRTDYMIDMIKALTIEGWAVAALDLPGHGQSSGRTLNVKLGVEAVAILHEAFGPFDYAIGHSFGGVVAVNAAVGGIKGIEPVPLKRIAIIASPNSMPELFASVGRRLGLQRKAQEAFEDIVHKVAGFPLGTYVIAEQLKYFGGDVLVIHAPDDREVKFADAEAMASAGRHVRLMSKPGLGHRRIIADPAVFKSLCDFGSDVSVVRTAA